jgi:predicted TIM-barrel fold metal-dependent hydrolase
MAKTESLEYVLPDVLGHTMDVDSHEMAPTHRWGMYGPCSERVGGYLAAKMAQTELNSDNNSYAPGVEDVAPMTPEIVWSVKGPKAPGAFDISRRLQVLDVMGTYRQLMFPSTALFVLHMLSNANGLRAFFGFDDTAETDTMLRTAVAEYNEWAMTGPSEQADRVRRVAVITAETVGELMTETSVLMNGGVRAVWLRTGPIGGCSPADPALDPFWSMMEDADMAVTLHIGREQGFRASDVWLQAPAFAPGKVDSVEILLEPLTMTTVQLAAEMFLSAMVLGGVFERHPRLRFAVIELGATWFGPLAEHLDLWVRNIFRKRMSTILTMAPSDYLARNVRVTPFYFEPIDQYFERFPHLQDSYCYSTDYPHVEGGKRVKESSYEKLAPLGSTVVQKYFIDNGAWLLPD